VMLDFVFQQLRQKLPRQREQHLRRSTRQQYASG
jgi:hypothetical protein